MADIPSKEEIAQLPRWAQVAFAARCARRALPFYNLWPAARRKYRYILEQATVCAERAAATATARNVAFAYNATKEASLYTMATCLVITKKDAENSAISAKSAVSAAVSAVASVNDNSTVYDAVVAAKDAITYKVIAAKTSTFRLYKIDFELFIQAIREDFTKLREGARAGNWNDDTPVKPDFFGALWPGKYPEILTALEASATAGRAKENKENTNPIEKRSGPLSLYFDLNDFTPQDIAQMIGLLSELYEEVSADQLVIDDMTILDPVDSLCPVEV